MSLDTATPMSDADVLALTKAAFEHARQDMGHRAAAEPTAAREQHAPHQPPPQPPPPPPQQQQPGITIDLGHQNIARLPDDVIDVIRSEIERLALSHNLLATLPQRLVECRRLRYLNVRYNAMREIPPVVGTPTIPCPFPSSSSSSSPPPPPPC